MIASESSGSRSNSSGRRMWGALSGPTHAALGKILVVCWEHEGRWSAFALAFALAFGVGQLWQRHVAGWSYGVYQPEKAGSPMWLSRVPGGRWCPAEDLSTKARSRSYWLKCCVSFIIISIVTNALQCFEYHDHPHFFEKRGRPI